MPVTRTLPQFVHDQIEARNAVSLVIAPYEREIERLDLDMAKAQLAGAVVQVAQETGADGSFRPVSVPLAPVSEFPNDDDSWDVTVEAVRGQTVPGGEQVEVGADLNEVINVASLAELAELTDGQAIDQDTGPGQVLLDVAACQAWLDRRLITV